MSDKWELGKLQLRPEQWSPASLKLLGRHEIDVLLDAEIHVDQQLLEVELPLTEIIEEEVGDVDPG